MSNERVTNERVSNESWSRDVTVRVCGCDLGRRIYCVNAHYGVVNCTWVSIPCSKYSYQISQIFRYLIYETDKHVKRRYPHSWRLHGAGERMGQGHPARPRLGKTTEKGRRRCHLTLLHLLELLNLVAYGR